MIQTDENIYVFIYATSKCLGNTFKYSGTYAVAKDTNWEDIRDHITEEMNRCFADYLDGFNKIPRAEITSMSEISKELYDRLHQKH